MFVQSGEIIHYSIILGFGPDGFPILGPDEYQINGVRPDFKKAVINGYIYEYFNKIIFIFKKFIVGYNTITMEDF